MGIKVKDGIKNTEVTDIDILTQNEIIEVKRSISAWDSNSNCKPDSEQLKLFCSFRKNENICDIESGLCSKPVEHF